MQFKWDLNQWKHTKTLKQSKRILRFNSRSERLGYISKSSNPNCYISKFHQSLNEMLNLHGKFAKYGHKEAFTRDMVVRESVRDHRWFSLDLISLILWALQTLQIGRQVTTGLIQATDLPRVNAEDGGAVAPSWRTQPCPFLETQVFHQPFHWLWLPFHWTRMVWGCLLKVFVAKGSQCGRFCGWALLG